MKLPFEGSYIITQKFGNLDVPDPTVYTVHNGTDYGLPSLTSLIGRGDWLINYAGIDPNGAQYQGGYGNMLRIRIDAEFEMYLGHLATMYVKSGQNVIDGQLLGLSDNSGFSTGPHLHLGLKKNGVWVDPELYFTNVSNNSNSSIPESTSFDNNLIITGKDLPCKVEVIAEYGLNFRPEATTDSIVIATLTCGTQVEIDRMVYAGGRSWFHVSGWIAGDTDLVRKV